MGDPRAQLLENMVAKFCSNIGGQERAMPVVRIVFQNQKCNTKKPSNQDLKKLIEDFTDILIDERGADAALDFQEDMKVRYRQLPQ